VFTPIIVLAGVIAARGINVVNMLVGKQKLKNGSPALDQTELNTVFLLNDHNRRFLAGTSAHIAEWWNRTLIAFPGIIAIIIFIGYMTVLSFQAIRDYAVLVIDGQQIDAKVINRRWHDGSKSSRNYLTYQFDAGSHTFVREQSVDRSSYEAYPVGTPIKIYYASSDPSHRTLNR
jgi:hypothetical protein